MVNLDYEAFESKVDEMKLDGQNAECLKICALEAIDAINRKLHEGVKRTGIEPIGWCLSPVFESIVFSGDVGELYWNWPDMDCSFGPWLLDAYCVGGLNVFDDDESGWLMNTLDGLFSSFEDPKRNARIALERIIEEFGYDGGPLNASQVLVVYDNNGGENRYYFYKVCSKRALERFFKEMEKLCSSIRESVPSLYGILTTCLYWSDEKEEDSV